MAVLLAGLLCMLVVCLLLAAIEAAFWLVNRGSKEGARPFLLDSAQLREQQRGVRQVGQLGNLSFLDPHLGFAHDPSEDRELSPDGSIPGFVVLGNVKVRDALRIVALGGSTTDPWDPDNWPGMLHELLESHGIPAVVFNGGVAGYSSDQEVLKLIRDGITIEPDIVVSLTGINDVGFYHSVPGHPMTHRYQARMLKALARQDAWLLPNTMAGIDRIRGKSTAANSRVEGIQYGVPSDSTPATQWRRNVRLMHAVGDEFDFAYIAFLQPALGVGDYVPTPEEEKMLADAARRWDGYLARIGEFYGEARERGNRAPYIADLSECFAGKSGLYRDSLHPKREGYRLIAQNIFAEMERRGVLKLRAKTGADEPKAGGPGENSSRPASSRQE